MPSDTETLPELLRPIRARGHRNLLAPKFGVKLAPSGEPVGLTMAELANNPRLSHLALTVFQELHNQLQGGEAAPERKLDPAAAAYRAKLELWADLLEIFLEETIAEIERLDANTGKV